MYDNWKKYKLRQLVIDMGDGGTPDTNKKEYFDGAIPWAVIQDIRSEIFDTKTKLTEKGLASCSAKLWPTGSVILSTGATIGEVGIAKVPLATKQGITGIVCKPKLLNQFLYYKLQFLKDYLKAYSQGSTIKEIRVPFLSEIEILLPPIEEQTQIANILATIDKTIEQTEAIIVKQQRIKTGLMQDLLTRGIDEYGNIRSEATHKFKDSPLGRIPVEWEVPKLGTLAHLITSGSRGWAKYYSDEGAIFIRIGNLTREHINLRLDDIVYVNPPYSSEGKRTSVSEGDLLVSITADLGIIGIIPPNMGEAYVNQHIALVKLDENLINPRWVGHYLCSKTAQKQFKTLNETGAKAGLNLPTVASLNVVKPNRLEQDKIVSILDLKDLAISESKKELLKYTQLKTGLMQDLLTGNVRVTQLLDT